MYRSRIIITAFFLCLTKAAAPSGAADTIDRLVTAAAKEGELVFVAGSETFGGRKGFADLGAAFNKKFGLSSRINFAAGPEMNSMAARVVTEVKTGRASTDFYLGSQSHYALLHQEN